MLAKLKGEITNADKKENCHVRQLNTKWLFSEARYVWASYTVNFMAKSGA